MGKRKAKDHRTIEDEDRPSHSSDVFKSIFGDVSEKSHLFSIFSDANPFKRKINEVTSRDGVPEGVVDGRDGVKRRKVDEEEGEGGVLGGASPVVNGLKKKKKEEGKKKDALVDYVARNYDGEVEGDGGVVGLKGGEVLGDETDEDRKGMKKRKRDELERLYEVKKYGQGIDEEAKGSDEKITGKKRKKADDSVDALVTKEEGFDDEMKLLRTVFVGNLPLKMKKKALVKEFSKFGEVESVRIRSVPLLDTKTPRKGAIRQKEINDAVDRVHAYVVFKDEKSAQEALAHNMATVGGNHIRVDRACPPRKKMRGDNSSIYDNKRSIFIGNLPFDVKDEEIYQLFASISNVGSSIEAVRVVRDPNSSLGKGIAYVLFKTKDVVNLVMKVRNLKLRDRDLRVSRSKPNMTPAKRSNPSFPPGSNSSGKKWAFSPGSSSGNKAGLLSYQGLKATKDVTTPRKSTIKVLKPIQFKKEGSDKRGGGKQRMKKRPAVAARKAKENGLREFGSATKMDRKRKNNSRTPDSFRKNKKIRKLK
ncbi:hypothetical protein MLD38_038971 [Melastoma candidum]|uniref:Uncharacterized protein n=1 Tax=Melastoma candidum TaxID=119954 RepID=A0ACB9L0L0_9MYRT|nr:hypothetical protein MLD38_038971 [Melastoma candidum]